VIAFTFLVGYNIFLVLFPLKKSVFYTNEERVEEYVYDKVSYTNVLVGSSLSQAIQVEKVFNGSCFNLYLPLQVQLPA
jgi:hypothetical protein